MRITVLAAEALVGSMGVAATEVKQVVGFGGVDHPPTRRPGIESSGTDCGGGRVGCDPWIPCGAEEDLPAELGLLCRTTATGLHFSFLSISSLHA